MANAVNTFHGAFSFSTSKRSKMWVKHNEPVPRYKMFRILVPMTIDQKLLTGLGRFHVGLALQRGSSLALTLISHRLESTAFHEIKRPEE
jgi:hypothetical protein